MKPDFQGLMNVAKAGEENPELHMGYWADSCGTNGCLIGSFCLANQNDNLKLYKTGGNFSVCLNYIVDPITAISKRFNISENCAKWLFELNPLKFMKRNVFYGDDPVDMSGEDAIKRLRKFLYFKMKQDEIHETWNNRYHKKHDQSENTGYVAEKIDYKEELELVQV